MPDVTVDHFEALIHDAYWHSVIRHQRICFAWRNDGKHYTI